MPEYQRKRVEIVRAMIDPICANADAARVACDIIAALDRLAHEDVDERLRDAFQLAARQEN